MVKRILFVNATYVKKISTLITAKRLGYEVTVIGTELPDWAIPYVDRFIHANTYNKDETINAIKESNIKYDGVITFWDRDVVLIAEIAKQLGLVGCEQQAAKIVRNKWEMRSVFREKNVPHPQFRLVRSIDDLEKAIEELEFPLIIKPVGASASKGVFKINNRSESIETYNMLKVHATSRNDMMFSFNPGEYIVEEYMAGKEVSVEGLISKGVIKYAGITEKWVDKYFEEYMHAFPARLDARLEEEIYKVTSEAIRAIGLNNCGFHGEIMITNEGCKVVEINGRIGGDFIPTHLIPISNGIDLVESNLKLVMGEDFHYETEHGKGACVKFIIADHPGTVIEWQGINEVKGMKGIIDFVIEKEVGCYVGFPPYTFHDTRIAYIIAEGENTDEAIINAENALNKVRCIISE